MVYLSLSTFIGNVWFGVNYKDHHSVYSRHIGANCVHIIIIRISRCKSLDVLNTFAHFNGPRDHSLHLHF